MTRLLTVLVSLLLIAAAFASLRLLEAAIEADVYREWLEEMSADYQALRDRYNQAVRRTAVTELNVDDGELTVVIRTAEGELQSLVSPFDPSREIYVDYVVLDGRLWIRRLFDDATAPDDGMIVDPRFVDVDWDSGGESHGKAAYRSLTPGRWVVDVTGDGSLGLTLRDADQTDDLSPPPPIRRYETVDAMVDAKLGDIRLGEALSALMRQLDSSG